MKRRDFITILAGSAAAWPLMAIAQVRSPPVIGFLGSQSSDHEVLAKFHQGLNESGYFEGRNVAIEYRWALNQSQMLPELAAELVRLQVEGIVASGSPAIRAAQHATRTIPFVMAGTADPVGAGLVASLARPGGNTTGVNLNLLYLSA